MVLVEIDFLFKRLTSVVERETVLEHEMIFDVSCTLCGKQGINGFEGMQVENSYKVAETRCRSCQSLFISNVGIMGVENPRRPNTGQKFGMLGGSGCYIDNNRSVFFLPPGSYKKLPPKFFQLGIEVVEISKFKQATWLVEQHLNYPCLWINDFGKKTKNLIENLEYSYSEDFMIPCTDDELNLSNKHHRAIDLKSIINITNYLKDIKKKASNYIKFARSYFNGAVSPEVLHEEIKSDHCFKSFFDSLNNDPHIALKQLSLLVELLKK